MRQLECDALATTLGDEIEAFLHGRYIQWLVQEGLPLRPAAHLNLAAHGEAAAIAAHVAARGVPSSARTFADAGVLIGAILLTAGAPEQLREAQAAVVVPLELRLMDEVISPRALVARVADVLFAV